MKSRGQSQRKSPAGSQVIQWIAEPPCDAIDVPFTTAGSLTSEGNARRVSDLGQINTNACLSKVSNILLHLFLFTFFFFFFKTLG